MPQQQQQLSGRCLLITTSSARGQWPARARVCVVLSVVTRARVTLAVIVVHTHLCSHDAATADQPQTSEPRNNMLLVACKLRNTQCARSSSSLGANRLACANTLVAATRIWWACAQCTQVIESLRSATSSMSSARVREQQQQQQNIPCERASERAKAKLVAGKRTCG